MMVTCFVYAKTPENYETPKELIVGYMNKSFMRKYLKQKGKLKISYLDDEEFYTLPVQKIFTHNVIVICA
jgi:hypothetical protein